MKKLVMLFSILVVVFNLVAFAGGDGSVSSPYQVSNATELNDVRNYLDSHFIQTRNIDLDVAPYNTGDGWLPIGSVSVFSGSYDGDGYVIDNLFINRAATRYVGLFSQTEGASLKSLGVTNVDITALGHIGALAGNITGGSTVSKCYSTGTITASNTYNGGLIGYSRYSSVNDCYSTVSVTSTSRYTGGLIGYLSNNSVDYTNCYSTGTATGSNYTGGLIGRLSDTYGDQSSACFYDTQTSGHTTSEIGTGKTTLEMKTLGTFSDWDFTNTWGINANTNSGYPFLGTGSDDELPVTLSSFSGSFTNGSSLLSWTTQSESSNMGWNVYRSTDEEAGNAMILNYELIAGAGTSIEPTNYSFTDVNELMENETYYYWIEDVTYGNVTTLHGPASVTVTEDGEDPNAPDLTQKTQIHNYPNPFNPHTQIFFNLKDDETAEKIEIFNSRGQKVITIDSPSNPQLWDGKDFNGAGVSSGIYMYNLTTNKTSYVKKMVLSK